MRHPAVVDIYDYGVFDGREYIAMEYFPCGDLKARILNPITEGEAIDYLKRIAGGAVRHPRRRAYCIATSSRRTSCCARMARSC